MARLEHTLRYAPFYLISKLPFPLLYVVSDACFLVVFYVVRYRRSVVSENVSKSFPKKSQRETRQIEKDFYRHLCDMMFESLKRLTIKEDEIKKRFQVKNLDLLERYLKKGRNVLFYAAHQGNWEWLVFLPVYLNIPSYTFYRPFTNHYFDRLLLLQRTRFGVRGIREYDGYRHLLRLLSSDGSFMNCMIGDQGPRHNSAKYWLRFLKSETAFFTGPEAFAKKSDSVVIFPEMRKLGRGRYEMELILLTDRPKQEDENRITEKYASVLENALNRSPSMWLWSHRRWKRKRPPEVSDKKIAFS